MTSYDALVLRVRDAAHALLPADAHVLVVSHGNDAFLDIGGRRVSHFPQTESGEPGDEPDDSAEAIEHLEQRRADGADFLVFPNDAFWWLDYYVGLREHLFARHRLCARRPDTCAIFALGADAGTCVPDGGPLPLDGIETALFHHLFDDDRSDAAAELLVKFSRLQLASLTEFRRLEREGIHVTPVHYYSPVPDTGTLPEALWNKRSSLGGVDMNEARQLELLRDAFPRFRDEFASFASERADGPGPFPDPPRFFRNNYHFDGPDAAALYCIVRHFAPSTVLEVGSGYSSLVAGEAAVRNGKTKLVCIEPNPHAPLRRGFPGLASLRDEEVQNVDVAVFEELERDDVLFIDSTHVARCGSDVNYLFLEVVPRLQPGVLVHVHDIFFPYDYPRDWVIEELRFWNEQYLLQAFLAFNSEFEVLLSNRYLEAEHPDELRQAFGEVDGGCASLWLRRRADR